MDECISQGILKEFLLKNKAEVKRMSIFEYDEEAVRKVLKKEAYEEGEIKGRKEGKREGKKDGKRESILELLEETGSVPKNLRKEILAQKDEDILRKWLLFAAKAESIEAFSTYVSGKKDYF